MAEGQRLPRRAEARPWQAGVRERHGWTSGGSRWGEAASPAVLQHGSLFGGWCIDQHLPLPCREEAHEAGSEGRAPGENHSASSTLSDSGPRGSETQTCSTWMSEHICSAPTFSGLAALGPGGTAPAALRVWQGAPRGHWPPCPARLQDPCCFGGGWRQGQGLGGGGEGVLLQRLRLL